MVLTQHVTHGTGDFLCLRARRAPARLHGGGYCAAPGFETIASMAGPGSMMTHMSSSSKACSVKGAHGLALDHVQAGAR